MLVCCVVRYGVCDMMNDIFGNKKRRKMQFIQLSVWMRWLAGRLFPTRCFSFLSVSPFPSFPIYHSFFFPSLSLFFFYSSYFLSRCFRSFFCFVILLLNIIIVHTLTSAQKLSRSPRYHTPLADILCFIAFRKRFILLVLYSIYIQ